MRNRFAALFLTAFLCLPATARAGCPAQPPGAATLTVTGCRFYKALEDERFVADVHAHVQKFFAGLDTAARAQKAAETIAGNTGAIVTARQDGKGAAVEYFFRTGEADACGKFETGKSYAVEIAHVCETALFEAPAPAVITLADEKDAAPLFAPAEAEEPLPVPGAAEAPPAMSDAEVLAWAENAVRDIFRQGAPAGAENAFPAVLAEGAWKNLPGRETKGLKPVAGDLSLSDPVILQVGVVLMGGGRLWTADWDADFVYATGDGNEHHAQHLRLLIERAPQNPSGLSITAVTVREKGSADIPHRADKIELEKGKPSAP